MQPNFDAGEDFALLLEREARKLEEKAQALTAAFTASASTVTSADGSVTVTVEANGSLSAIEFGSRSTALGPARLSALVMRTVREAQRKTVEKVTESYTEINGEDEAAQLVRTFLPKVDEEESTPENPEQDKWAPEAHNEPPRPQAGFRPPPPQAGPPMPPQPGRPVRPPNPPAPRPRRPASPDDDEMSPW
ncbi:YbaB/EbfC family nucleoid-associated protein [Amycolatopsis sp. NPDC102389]|uniref:YbaB/EbfC family nucleoid-associated protein n=1 Tax=Amycolatopsis sp. NPDC102389 TaxID=3363941 RepID=UPI00380844EC